MSCPETLPNGRKKKFRTKIISRCSTVKNKKITDMCNYFQYSRAAYYKSLKEQVNNCYSETIMLEMVQRERCLQPRIGGRKLYFMLRSGIHEVDPHFGRDKFFDLLRKYKLLIEPRRNYCKTTNSWHHFHKYNNEIKDLLITRSNQVWAADITYNQTKK
jgi:hypothetical protein